MAAKLTPENSKGKLGGSDLPKFEDFTFAERASWQTRKTMRMQ